MRALWSGFGLIDRRKVRRLVRPNDFYFICPFLLMLCLAIPAVHGQAVGDEMPGIGEIRLAAPLSTLPFPCADPVACEAPYESAWIRVWHADGVIQRIDVVYSGKKGQSLEEKESTPITLAQAIKAHSIWNGRKAPRLGLGGIAGSVRVIVDYPNGVAYFANGAMAESTVSEVHYLPVTDAMVATASSSPLWEQGRWLVKAAWAAARYKSTQGEGATGNPNARVVDESLTPEELTLQLQKLSQALTVYATATLMLSEHVSESLKSNQRPDPDVSAELKK